MNWFKESQLNKYSKINSFDDRNIINQKIRLFKQIVSFLELFKKEAIKNPREAKKALDKIINHRLLSSYRDLKKDLLFVSSKLLDNSRPNTMSSVLDPVIYRMLDMIHKLVNERSEFINKTLPTRAGIPIKEDPNKHKGLV